MDKFGCSGCAQVTVQRKSCVWAVPKRSCVLHWEKLVGVRADPHLEESVQQGLFWVLACVRVEGCCSPEGQGSPSALHCSSVPHNLPSALLVLQLFPVLWALSEQSQTFPTPWPAQCYELLFSV